MIIKTTEELAEFTREKVKKSGLKLSEISERINKNRSGKKIGPDSISHAISESKKSDSGRNGMRCEILNLLGYSVNNLFSIKRQK